MEANLASVADAAWCVACWLVMVRRSGCADGYRRCCPCQPSSSKRYAACSVALLRFIASPLLNHTEYSLRSPVVHTVHDRLARQLE